MWEQVKQAMMESARSMWLSKSWGNDVVIAAVEEKEVAWKEVLGARLQKKGVWRLTKRKRERLKDVYIRTKRR